MRRKKDKEKSDNQNIERTTVRILLIIALIELIEKITDLINKIIE